jgi:DNA gyrase/topoisomerase IV subunit A
MNLFTIDGAIKKYETVHEILGDFYGPRLDMYHKRKENMIKRLEEEHTRLSNQVSPLEPHTI